MSYVNGPNTLVMCRRPLPPDLSSSVQPVGANWQGGKPERTIWIRLYRIHTRYQTRSIITPPKHPRGLRSPYVPRVTRIQILLRLIRIPFMVDSPRNRRTGPSNQEL